MAKIEDKNGFWFIEKNPITKVGVFPYQGKQISQDCEPNKIYYVLRPKEELYKKETLDSLRLIPIVDGHTMIGDGFTAPEDKGIDGMLGDNVTHDTDTIYNDLKIVSNKMKDEIRNGKKELSLGYFCRYDKQPGTYKGQRYDYVQRDIKANHLALVDRGRMGSDVRVYDSQNGGSFAMDSIDIVMDKDEDIEWITVRGTHIPIKNGESKEQAVKKFLEDKKTKNSEKSKVAQEEPNLDKEKLAKMKDLIEKVGGDFNFAKSRMKNNEDVDKMIDTLEQEAKKQEEKMNAPETILPKGFEKGDLMYSKKIKGKSFTYLGKNKDGLYIFADSKKYVQNDLQDSDMWLVSPRYLKNNLAEGTMELVYEGSENESAEQPKTESAEKNITNRNIKEYLDNGYKTLPYFKDGLGGKEIGYKLYKDKVDAFNLNKEDVEITKEEYLDILKQQAENAEKYKIKKTKENGEEIFVLYKGNRAISKSKNYFSLKKIINDKEQIQDSKAEDSKEYKTIQGEDTMSELEKFLTGKISQDEMEEVKKIVKKEEEKSEDDGEEVEENEEKKEVKEEKTAKDKCGKDEDKKEGEEVEKTEKKEDDNEEEKSKVIKAFAKKEKLAKEVEDSLGTFDHSEMTELEVARYACDKLELEVEKGQEISAIRGYLKGVASKPKVTVGYKLGLDSGIQEEDAEYAKFMKGEK